MSQDIAGAMESGPPAESAPTVSIVSEMRRSYLDYAMSVIVSRAIPDLRDGLKPVHRRILYAMQESGFLWNRPYRKAARVVGDVIGKYHPHGDTAVYDALVRMAQEFSMRLPLLDGQGNFGSLDGDSPAAMRYTEVRLAAAAREMLADIDRDTVDFQPNYDSQDEEPEVLPARIPNLFVNGAEGIAVAVATRIPPHNLGEIVSAAIALIANPDASVQELMEHVPGPDFPTGGQIVGSAGIRLMYSTGRGSIVVRATSRIEESRNGRAAIIVDEVPFQVNKARLVQEIARLSREKQIEGVAEVRDESDRQGVRVAIDLKRDATPEVIRNQLHRLTRMQIRFSANMIALVGRSPEQLNLRSYLTEFLAFRESVVRRRTEHDLAKARDRAHVLCGLAVAVENIDEVIAVIRRSPDTASAREALRAQEWAVDKIEPYLRLIDDPDQPATAAERLVRGRAYIQMSDAQVRAVLELRLNRLTALGREEIVGELSELGGRITEFLAILGDRDRVLEIVAGELRELQESHDTPRRTAILESEEEIEDEALIEREDVVVMSTLDGYVKRTSLDEFRMQRRGGKGLSGISTKEEDVVTLMFAADTLTPVLFFATDGRAYKLKVWRLPAGQRAGRGKHLKNLLRIEDGVTVTAMMPVAVPEEEWDRLQIVFVTSSGKVRRNELSDFAQIRANGKIAMRVDPGVSLVAAQICEVSDDVLLTSARGKSIRFPVSEIRLFASRNSMGVRGMRLAPGDEVVSMTILPGLDCTVEEAREFLAARRSDATLSPRQQELAEREWQLLFVDSLGSGKRVSSHEFTPKRRGGQGVRSMTLVDSKDGQARSLVAAFAVAEGDQIMLIADGGQAIRCPVDGIRITGRDARGVRLLDASDQQQVVSVARVAEVVPDESDDPAE